jgi:hypothetical protein
MTLVRDSWGSGHGGARVGIPDAGLLMLVDHPDDDTRVHRAGCHGTNNLVGRGRKTSRRCRACSGTCRSGATRCTARVPAMRADVYLAEGRARQFYCQPPVAR